MTFNKKDWTIAGIIGGLFALGAGLLVYSTKHKFFKANKSKGFAISLVVLVAAIMKSHGKPMKSELIYAHEFFLKNFGHETTSDAMILLKEVLTKNIEIDSVCAQISDNLNYPERLQLLHFLFGLANADAEISENEISLLNKISILLKIKVKDFESIKAMFFNDLDAAYRILEITSDSSIEQIKLAYRKIALMHHPDRVAHLGDEVLIAANLKFQKINEAYDKIKKDKGL